MRIFAFLSVFLTVMLLAEPAAAQFRTINRTHSIEGHTVVVRMDIGQFDPTQHTVKLFRPPGHSGTPCVEIDGVREPLGTDCELPTTEIYALSITLDGKPLTIPRELYGDCYNPQPGNSVVVRLSDDRKGVFVFFSGSDGAGSYQVLWLFRLDGRHTRISCSSLNCSDSGFLNFDSTFLRSNDR